MRGKSIFVFLGLVTTLLMAMLVNPYPCVSADVPTVSLGAYINLGIGGNPVYVTNVPTGGTFVVRVNVSQVSDFKAYQFQLNYDRNVIEVLGAEGGSQGVTAGLVGASPVPVDYWVFYREGTDSAVRVVGRIPNEPGVSGSGYLAEIHFAVIGAAGQSSPITPTDVPSGPLPFYNGLFDSLTNKITALTQWNGTSVQVFQSLQITNSSLPSGEVGLPYSQNLAAAGGLAPYSWLIQAGTLPSGLAVNSSTGAITGTPSTSGDFNLNITVTDVSSPPNVVNKTLALHVFGPVSVVASQLPDASQGAAYLIGLTGAGGQSPYTWTATGLPAGLSISTSGIVSGTPSVSGDFSPQITVHDSFSPPGNASKTLTLHVFSPISITSSTLPDASQGTSYSIGLSAVGGKGPYTWAATGLPSGLSILGGGVITGTPAGSGDFNVNVTASDAFNPPNSTGKTLTLHVFAPVSVTTASLPEGSQGAVYSANLAATGGKSPYTWTATGLPTGLALSTAGTISGTATVSGDFNVNITAADSFSPSKSGSKTLMLHIFATVGITTASLPEGSQGSPYSANLAAVGGKNPYSWSSTGLPSGLALSSSGTISGSPGLSGNFNVNVTVVDSANPANSTTKSLNIFVYPTLHITSLTLPVGEAGLTYSQNLSVSGGKSPYVWSVQSGSLPDGLLLSPSGVVGGVPTNAGGPASVTVQVTDSLGVSANQVISITVVRAPSIGTSSPLPNGEVGLSYIKVLTPMDGTGPYNWSATGLPAGLTIPATGVISGTPSATGNFNVLVTLTDSYTPAGSAIKNFTLHIYDAIQIVTASLTEALQNKACNQTLGASGGNAEYSWSASGLPDGLTISAAGVISGTPTQWGNFIVNVTLTDSLRGTNGVTKSLTLKVYMPYDANGNGIIDMGDVVKVERVILGFDAATPACDANASGNVDAADIVKLERVILKIDPST